jgi:hypothetical protein
MFEFLAGTDLARHRLQIRATLVPVGKNITVLCTLYLYTSILIYKYFAALPLKNLNLYTYFFSHKLKSLGASAGLKPESMNVFFEDSSATIKSRIFPFRLKRCVAP